MNKQQSGFTLIELIVVIVILGILAATALPKFADLTSDARKAKASAAQGALKSAVGLAHGKYLINPVSPQIFEGVSVTFVNGYPDAASIADFSGLTAPDYTTVVTGTTMNATVVTNCVVSYQQAASAILPPTITLTTTGC